MTEWQWIVLMVVITGFIGVFAIMAGLLIDEDLSSLRKLARGAKKVPLLRTARQVVVLVVGLTVVLGGVAMLVLPGPGLLGILAGIAILATEFAWARKLLRRARAYAKGAAREGKKRFRWFRSKNGSRRESAKPSE